MRVPVPMVCAAALGMAITRAARADDNQMLGTTPRSMAMAGAYTAIASGLPNQGTRSFTTPGANGAGNDWLLVLDPGP